MSMSAMPLVVRGSLRLSACLCRLQNALFFQHPPCRCPHLPRPLPARAPAALPLPCHLLHHLQPRVHYRLRIQSFSAPTMAAQSASHSSMMEMRSLVLVHMSVRVTSFRCQGAQAHVEAGEQGRGMHTHVHTYAYARIHAYICT